MFGDTEAKSSSIKNSIELLSDNSEFNAFNTYRDTIDYYDEYGDDIIIYTKEEVGEIIKTLQYIYNGYTENIDGCE